MARDGNGRDHKAAGRPDGGQFDEKAGQGLDDNPVPPEPSPDGANGAYMDRPGRMADDDPEPDDAEAFGTLGLDAAAPERHGIDRADFEEDVAGAISDGVAMDGYGVGLEDPR